MDELDDWLSDPATARRLWNVLVWEAARRRQPLPAKREELIEVLRAARTRLRRRLQLAEGLDPGTGQPGA